MFLSTRARRRIVIFADGTGNAFSTQESNVWRLYEALDKTGTDQIAHYIPGVGTSSFRPYAIVDGATGVGVPSNVRKLYRFICWNWRHGDELYMFGFSRGSFTIRTLIGLMHDEGLVPSEVGGQPVSRAQMNRNVMAAWRAYRAKTAPWYKYFPTVWIARAIRNLVILAADSLPGRQRYSKTRQQTEQQQRSTIPIKFVGLFDTVEAFGVPIEELRTAIDYVIWPISFKNYKLSSHVERAYHALSLDDERETFHPLRFDQADEAQTPAPSRITEVWFPGVHSDVGGGYPDSALEHVPLGWMLNNATTTPNDLRFDPSTIAAYRQAASPLGQCHDSRAGLAAFYRYSPRYIGEDRADGGAPVVHYSVAEKMAFGTEGYAPKTLPSTAYVLMPDVSKVAIQGFTGAQSLPHRAHMAAVEAAAAEVTDAMTVATEAVSRLRGTDSYIVSQVRDRIWWRRVAYFALLFAALAVASLPLSAQWLSDLTNTGPTAGLVNKTDAVLNGFYRALFAVPSSLQPSYSQPWVKAFGAFPLLCTVVVVLAGLLYRLNSSLRDQIADLARQAWFAAARSRKMAAKIASFGGQSRSQQTLARYMRKSAVIDWTQWVMTDVALLIVLVFFLFSKAVVVLDGGLGLHCTGTAKEQLKTLGPNEMAAVGSRFNTSDYCWASGVNLAQGRHYELWIDMVQPYFDQTLITGIPGFKDISLRHISALPLRREIFADWFAPIAQIAPDARVTWALESVGGDTAASNPQSIYQDPDFSTYLKNTDRTPKQFVESLKITSPIPSADLQAANEAAGKYDLGRHFVSRFVAPADGELFLYVNDAVFGYPSRQFFCGHWPFQIFEGFYKNNSGMATVTIKRLDGPPSSQPAPSAPAAPPVVH